MYFFNDHFLNLLKSNSCILLLVTIQNQFEGEIPAFENPFSLLDLAQWNKSIKYFSLMYTFW